MSDRTASAFEADRLRRELAKLEEQLRESIQNALRVPGAGLAHMDHQNDLQTRANTIRRKLGLPEQPIGNPPPTPRRWHRWALWLSLGAAALTLLSVFLSR